jgi:catalase (peroxidase I)
MTVEVPFSPGRMDASQEQTDVDGMAVLEPMADGFRNYIKTQYTVPTEALLVDKAQLLTLTAPEMTVLVGGMRALGANYDASKHGLFSTQKDKLTNDFFVNLLDMSTAWSAIDDKKEVFEGKDRTSGATKYTATRADLIFGSNSELRALAEVYAQNDNKERCVKIIEKGGWHFSQIMNPKQIQIKFLNDEHHDEYELNKLKYTKIKDMIKNKYIIYDHKADQKNLKKKWNNKIFLTKININQLPYYIKK